MSRTSVGGRSPGRSRKGSFAGSLAGSGPHAPHAGLLGSLGGSGPLGSLGGSQQSSRSHSPAPCGPCGPCLGGQRYVLLRQSLAITLRRTGSVPLASSARTALRLDDDDDDNDFWMYDNGYLLFQGLVEANARCFWSGALLEAMRELSFAGYVAPGVLLVRAGACALDVVRAAWARRVLKPPPNYDISDVGDVEDCCVLAVPQSQFTPLPEALCWVILELTSTGQAAVLPAILRALPRAFPAMTRPEAAVVYDALAKLSMERKVYQTARGFFLVTPETRRRLASAQSAHHQGPQRGRRSMLLSNEEALVMVHGDMQTERDGHRTHQCVQTNLADVICGGNPDDKVLYPREARALERRHSLRLSARLGSALQRAGSLRSLPPRPPPPPPPAGPASPPAPPAPPEKKQSLLSRLFRRSSRPRAGRARSPRNRRGQSAPPAPHAGHAGHAGHAPDIRTFSAQFPLDDEEDAERHPADWFNPRVTALASVATQTCTPAPSPSPSASAPSAQSSPGPGGRAVSPAARWDAERGPGRASTLPRSLSRGSPRRARRLSDSLSLNASGGPSPAASTLGPLASLTAMSLSPCPPPTVPATRKTSPSNTLLSSASSRASRASQGSRTSALSKASSGYNSSGTRSTRSGSPAAATTTTTTTARRSLPAPARAPCVALGSPSPACCSTTTAPRSTTSATISGGHGANTKIYVQQHSELSSPVRSIITIENRAGGGRAGSAGLGAGAHAEHVLLTSRGGPCGGPCASRGPVLETSFDRTVLSRHGPPIVLTTVMPTATTTTITTPSGGSLASSPPAPGPQGPPDAERYSSNKINNHNLSGKSTSTSSASSSASQESLTSASSLVTKEAEMNNIRKLLLTSPTTPAGFLRESLSYKNILKEVQNYPVGPSLSPHASMASLSDLSMHCKSLAAQRILSGVSINSVDTLVEVNMAASLASGLASDKKANCDLTIRTDLGTV